MNTILKKTIMHSLLLIGMAVMLKAQENVWLKLEKGDAVVLLPKTAQWQPLVSKSEIPSRTFLLTKENSSVKIFVATEIYEVDESNYIFIEDVIEKSRPQLVAELTRIEAEQLPNSEHSVDSLRTNEVGLTYGNQPQIQSSITPIPFRTERFNAVNSFLKHNRYDAAVLTLKRMLVKYPSLYLDQAVVEQLFSLYDRLGLVGFLFDESAKLIPIIKNEVFSNVLMNWNKKAKNTMIGN